MLLRPHLLLFTLLFALLLAPGQVTAATRPAANSAVPVNDLTFAYFPTAVPISVLGETMQRDRILQRNLAKLGFRLHFRPFAKGSDAMPLIRAGRIAGVSFADMPAIEAASSYDMQILGFVKQSYSSIIAPSGTQLKDLRKKRIGNAHGSTAHYALLQALTSAGMSDREVTLVPMDVSSMLEALENGTIDAFAAWEPTPTVALKQYPGKYAQIGRQTSYSFFLLADQLARSHPEAAREIAAALVRAIRWLRKRDANLLAASRWAQAGAQSFSGKQLPISDQEIARITDNDLLDVPGAPALPAQLSREDSLLLKEFEFLKQIGKLPQGASRNKLTTSLTGRLMHDIIAAPARYQLNRFDYAN